MIRYIKTYPPKRGARIPAGDHFHPKLEFATLKARGTPTPVTDPTGGARLKDMDVNVTALVSFSQINKVQQPAFWLS
jgi:hypothetical protein